MEKSVVTITLTGVLLFWVSLFAEVYYVDDVPINGSGTQASPFNNLNSAAYAAQAGDMIYVLLSSGVCTSTGLQRAHLTKPGR